MIFIEIKNKTDLSSIERIENDTSPNISWVAPTDAGFQIFVFQFLKFLH